MKIKYSKIIPLVVKYLSENTPEDIIKLAMTNQGCDKVRVNTVLLWAKKELDKNKV